MDLISLACQEVGLDLELDAELVEGIFEDINNYDYEPGYQYGESSAGDRLDMMTPKQLSFNGDLPNTVFTDKDGMESTVILQNTRWTKDSPLSFIVKFWC